MPPANGVQCAEEVRHQREGGARANVPRGAGEPAERGPARMADHIRFLEAADAVLGLVVGGRVIAGLGEWIRCAQRRHLGPGVAPGIRVAGDDCVRHVVADLDRRLHFAAMRAAEQPVTDPDDLVFEALRERVEETMAALLIAAEAVNERLKVAAAAARRRRLRLVISATSWPWRSAQERAKHPVRRRPRTAYRLLRQGSSRHRDSTHRRRLVVP